MNQSFSQFKATRKGGISRGEGEGAHNPKEFSVIRLMGHSITGGREGGGGL